MLVWVFIVSLVTESFGGPVAVRFETTSQVACEKLRRVVIRETETMKRVVSECVEVKR